MSCATWWQQNVRLIWAMRWVSDQLEWNVLTCLVFEVPSNVFAVGSVERQFLLHVIYELDLIKSGLID